MVCRVLRPSIYSDINQCTVANSKLLHYIQMGYIYEDWQELYNHLCVSNLQIMTCKYRNTNWQMVFDKTVQRTYKPDCLRQYSLCKLYLHNYSCKMILNVSIPKVRKTVEVYKMPFTADSAQWNDKVGLFPIFNVRRVRARTFKRHRSIPFHR